MAVGVVHFGKVGVRVGNLFQLAFFSCILLQLHVLQSCIMKLAAELSRIYLCAFLQSDDHDQFQARCMKLHQKVFEFEMYQRRGRRMETLWIYYNDLFPNDVALERKTEEQTGNKFRMINYIKFF